MIIHCEECGKQFNIDENKIIKSKTRFKCLNCKSIIEVVKPDQSAGPLDPEKASSSGVPPQSMFGNLINQSKNTGVIPKDESDADWKIEEAPNPQQTTGLTISKKLLYLFLAFIITTGTVLTLVYLMYVPTLMYSQINLRTYSISKSFSAAIEQPLLLKDYLLVNKNAEINASLPGVAYVSVANKKGIVVSGLLGDSTRFSADFRNKVKENGFPKEISTRNTISGSEKTNTSDFILDGQKIHDVAVDIGDNEGVAHVGLFTAEAEKAVQKSLIPLLSILTVIAFLGYLSFLLVARTISNPIKLLTLAAEKISLGEINLPIEVKGGGEIGELAASLERMRFSIKIAIDRIKRK